LTKIVNYLFWGKLFIIFVKDMAILTFNNSFEPHKTRFTHVSLNEKEIHNCVLYMKKIFERDQKNRPPSLIKKEKYERMFTNLCAVTAISRVVNFPFINYSNFDKDPVTQLRETVGPHFDIVVFNYGEFPLFYYKMYKKAIFICKVSKLEYIVCGYGTPYIINSFHSKSLISSPEIRQNSSMSAFYGFEHLRSLPKNIYDFKTMVK